MNLLVANTACKSTSHHTQYKVEKYNHLKLNTAELVTGYS